METYAERVLEWKKRNKMGMINYFFLLKFYYLALKKINLFLKKSEYYFNNFISFINNSNKNNLVFFNRFNFCFNIFIFEIKIIYNSLLKLPHSSYLKFHKE